MASSGLRAALLAAEPMGRAAAVSFGGVVLGAGAFMLQKPLLAREVVPVAIKGAAREVAKVVDMNQLRKVIHWQDIASWPRWVRIALAVGAGSWLFLQAIKWVLRRPKFEGVRRSCSYFAALLPVVFKYRLVERRVKKQKLTGAAEKQAYDDFHEWAAPKVADFVARTGGVYTKIGQIISQRRDFAHPTWIREMSVFLEDVKSRPVQEIIQVIEEDLGKPMCDIFESFNVVPIASASLSQVHMGRLKGTSEDVVVKVQYADIARLLPTDIRAMNALNDMFYPEMKEISRETEKQFKQELDFIHEAENLRVIGHNMASVPNAVVPKPHYATGRVLVMTYIPGLSVQADPRPMDQKLPLMRQIVEIMGKQMLVDGVFNGDPHMGNFLLMPDGRIGCIDLGQVKFIDHKIRYGLAHLIKAMRSDNDTLIAKAMFDLGYRSKKQDERVVAKLARYSFDTIPVAIAADSSAMKDIDEAMKADPMKKVNPEFLFAWRAMMLMRGALWGAPGVSLAAWLEPSADQAIAEEATQTVSSITAAATESA